MNATPCYCLGVSLDDSDYTRLFKDSLSAAECEAIRMQPHTERERDYVKVERREEQLTILDQGAYMISWDRQQRAALIAVHATRESLEATPVDEFIGATMPSAPPGGVAALRDGGASPAGGGRELPAPQCTKMLLLQLLPPSVHAEAQPIGLGNLWYGVRERRLPPTVCLQAA